MDNWHNDQMVGAPGDGCGVSRVAGFLLLSYHALTVRSCEPGELRPHPGATSRAGWQTPALLCIPQRQHPESTDAPTITANRRHEAE